MPKKQASPAQAQQEAQPQFTEFYGSPAHVQQLETALQTASTVMKDAASLLQDILEDTEALNPQYIPEVRFAMRNLKQQQRKCAKLGYRVK